MARLAVLSLRSVMWPMLIAIAGGAAAYAFRYQDSLPLLATNRLPQPQRMHGVFYFVATALAIAAVYGAVSLGVRLKEGAWRTGRVTSYLNRLFAFVLGLPFVVALFTPNIETQSPKTALLYAAFAGLCAVPTFMVLSGQTPAWLSRAGKYGAPLLLAAGVIGYGLFFSSFAITNHHSLTTRTIDLGYYDNIFYQSIHGNPLGCSFLKGGTHISGHFDTDPGAALTDLSDLSARRDAAGAAVVLARVRCGTGLSARQARAVVARRRIGHRGALPAAPGAARPEHVRVSLADIDRTAGALGALLSRVASLQELLGHVRSAHAHPRGRAAAHVLHRHVRAPQARCGLQAARLGHNRGERGLLRAGEAVCDAVGGHHERRSRVVRLQLLLPRHDPAQRRDARLVGVVVDQPGVHADLHLFRAQDRVPAQDAGAVCGAAAHRQARPRDDVVRLRVRVVGAAQAGLPDGLSVFDAADAHHGRARTAGGEAAARGPRLEDPRRVAAIAGGRCTGCHGRVQLARVVEVRRLR